MRLLFDHNIPAALRSALADHEVTLAEERGWEALANGDLLEAAEAAGFDVVVTADQNIEYQQNLRERRIGLVVLSTNRWPVIRDHLPHVTAEINRAAREAYVDIRLPRPPLIRRPAPDRSE